MSSICGRLCLWPFALCATFSHALGGRDTTDYYGQSAPRCRLLPKPAFPLSGTTTWVSGSCLVTGMGSGWLPNTFPQFGGLRTGPSTHSRPLGPTDGTLRVHRPSIFAGLQFSWHPRPRMPAVGWSCLAFAIHRLTPAHPFLNVRVLEVGLLLTTRSCSLEADRPRVAWFSESPG
jgi:hypothetical protein